jgi:hypothetical protein
VAVGTQAKRAVVLAPVTALVVVGVCWAAAAWACVGVVSLTVSTNSVQPGGMLMVTGREFAAGGAPVVIHLDSVTGPVLATVPVPGQDTMTSKWTVSVTLPSDLTAGQHLLVATQDAHDMNSGAPARSVLYVGGAGPAASPAANRPAALAVNQGPGLAGLVLLVVLVAGLSLAVVGVWSWLRSRSGSPRPAAS